MKQTTTLLLTAAAIFLAAFSMGCSTVVTPTSIEVTLPPTEIVPPTPIPAPSAIPTFLPACGEETACQSLNIDPTEAGNTYCVQKIPYLNFSLKPGAEIKVPPGVDLSCKDSGTQVDGKHIWTCTGRQLWSYEVTITNPACKPRNLIADASKCPPELRYDAEQTCCAPIDSGTGEAKVIVNMGGCAP